MAEKPTPRFIILTTALLLTYHFGLWWLTAATHELNVSAFLNNWDAGWYTQIVVKGYDDQAWAFYPLYPLLVRRLALGIFAAPHAAIPVIGAVFSTVLFLIFCWLAAKNQQRASPLFAQTRLGWLCFILWPGAMIFHTHHTEALFLLLSFGAFYFASQQRLVLAAAAAGLCALTRNHGVFVAITAAVWLAAPQPTPREKMKVFTLSGLISGGLFCLFPLYQYWHTGDFLRSVHVQAQWAHMRSPVDYFKTFFFMNEWQNTNSGSIFRYIGFWFLALATVWLARRSKVLALYPLMFLLLMPAQGELINVFRFGAVLFPVLYAAGDHLAGKPR